MYDYESTTGPWYGQRSKIKSVEVSDGVTSIGKGAFSDCSGFTGDLVIPDSVTEIVETFEKVNGIKVNHIYGARRAGDMPECYANADKALNILDWKTEKTLEDMCRDSWNWQKNNPNGYRN